MTNRRAVAVCLPFALLALLSHVGCGGARCPQACPSNQLCDPNLGSCGPRAGGGGGSAAAGGGGGASTCSPACAGSTPVCDVNGSFPRCVTCTASAGCSGLRPQCLVITGNPQCVECLTSQDCGGRTCDPASHTCAPTP